MPIIVYKPYHRIPIKIGDAIIKVAPLTEGQRGEIESTSLLKEGGLLTENIFNKAKLLFKYSIKEVEGIVLATGEKYLLEFDDDQRQAITDECVNDFFNMSIRTDMTRILWAFFTEFTNEAKDVTGKVIKGLEILPPEGGDELKK